MPDIKIFVSQRIDRRSVLIENPLYVPVRCGAVFDQKNLMNVAGDDTGDNISEKRLSFCEFTVQYWAWKNVEADYYGLCHYRRFLSFSETSYPVEDHGMVEEPWFTPEAIRKYNLDNPKKMQELIPQYDVIISEPANVKKMITPKGYQKTIWDVWTANVGLLLEEDSLELMLALISRLSPEYCRAAEEYLTGTKHRGYNCYVLRKELFERLCWFQYPILFEMEKYQKEHGHLSRVPGYIGEILYGIFMYQVIELEQWRVRELQLVRFRDAAPIQNSLDLAWRNTKHGMERILRTVVDPILPKGSLRRERCKRICYQLLSRKK